MRAVVHDRYRPLEMLRLEEIERPTSSVPLAQNLVIFMSLRRAADRLDPVPLAQMR